ncbi:SEL1-like repeat protein [Flaviflagellibacter deserti]|uniref:SEL1-like repeat protein n=1 Tax=Flaviflagellibacter deserti TaxID=2267266 RepID=A0ABV9Z558_9HYPH
MSNQFEPQAPDDMFAPKGRTPTPQAHDPFADADHFGYQAFAQQYAAAQQPTTRKKPVSGHSKMMLRLSMLVLLVGAGIGGFIGYRHFNGQPLFQDREPTLFEVASTKAAMASLAAAETERTVTILQPPPAEPIETARASTTEPDPVQEPAPAPAPEIAALTQQPPPPPQPQVVQAPPPPAPVVPKLTQSELALLMERGHRFVESGDFASARPLYRRAAEAGYAEAALALGDTYDPTFLKQRRVVGLAPDPAKARQWYQRALELGSLEADMKLGRLAQ